MDQLTLDTRTGGCCPLAATGGAGDTRPSRVAAYVRTAPDGDRTLSLIVPDITCAGCIARVEQTARAIPGVTQARVNFSTRRLTLAWQGPAEIADRIVQVLEESGYPAIPFAAEEAVDADADALKMLIRALGVAGFAAMNVMLLSVSVWAGTDMAAATQSLFHWLSALIVLPAVAYAGQPFYRGAARALRARRLSMDVPISLAVILAAGMSLYQTAAHGDAVYFDASIMLLFFLLLGRVLDLRVRARARSAAQRLLALRSRAAAVIGPDGSRRYLKPEELLPGMRVQVASGERVPADGHLASAAALIDASLLTGESLPEHRGRGEAVFAGTVNLGDPIELDVTATAGQTLLAEIVRLMEAAEQGRDRYVRLADRVVRAYAPAVHLFGLATVGIWLGLGAGWEASLLNGIAVLIITCPCALALAVPAVQVVAAGRLLGRNVLMKSGDALERLAEADTVVFDKTGTLTTGALQLQNAADIDADILAQAAALARDSRHPLSRALVRAAGGCGAAPAIGSIREIPGCGLSGETEAGTIRLGSRQWVGAAAPDRDDTRAEIWFRDPDGHCTRLAFRDTLRADAAQTIAELQRGGLDVILLSGDRESAVAALARETGIARWQAACSPRDKIAALEALAADGRTVFMIGDGLNDAPALAAAHVSMSPSDAADIAQNAADFVNLSDGLLPVWDTMRTARLAKRLVLQNFALSFGYNALAIPIAMLGLVTPLIVAVAMSLSSIAVTANALRLKWTS